MIQLIATVIVLLFTLGAALLVAGPLYEGIVPVITSDPAVQSMGHASIADRIMETVLVWVPMILIGGVVVVYSIAWILRREQFRGRY